MSITGPIAGAAISAAGSLGAAGTQSAAAKQALALEQANQQQAIGYQNNATAQEQSNQQPFLSAGQGAINTLAGLVPGLNAAEAAYPNFTAPTAAQAAATPGYQFTAQQGQQAVQNSAAASGGLLGGNALNAEQQYGQGLASTTYQQTYNNALSGYQQNYQAMLNNLNNTYNRYAGLVGVGQGAANTLGSEEQAGAANVGNILTQGGAQQAQQINNAAAAQASGYAGVANAATSGINNLSQYSMLNNLLSGQGGSVANGGMPVPNQYQVDPVTGGLGAQIYG